MGVLGVLFIFCCCLSRPIVVSDYLTEAVAGRGTWDQADVSLWVFVKGNFVHAGGGFFSFLEGLLFLVYLPSLLLCRKGPLSIWFPHFS